MMPLAVSGAELGFSRVFFDPARQFVVKLSDISVFAGRQEAGRSIFELGLLILLTAIRPAVCVLIAYPEPQDLPSEDVLRKLFGLTPAEARLTARLARGDALQSAAAELGMGYATARTQLAVIFRKTGTRRQSELVKQVLTHVPSLL